MTSDSDFVEAVRTVKDFGKHVELAAFTHGLSTELKTACDRYVQLSRNWFPANMLHQGAAGLTAVPPASSTA